eukprot:364485-Chlamydomonas_euryale.AAC.4
MVMQASELVFALLPRSLSPSPPPPLPTNAPADEQMHHVGLRVGAQHVGGLALCRVEAAVKVERTCRQQLRVQHAGHPLDEQLQRARALAQDGRRRFGWCARLPANRRQHQPHRAHHARRREAQVGVETGQKLRRQLKVARHRTLHQRQTVGHVVQLPRLRRCKFQSTLGKRESDCRISARLEKCHPLSTPAWVGVLKRGERGTPHALWRPGKEKILSLPAPACR